MTDLVMMALGTYRFGLETAAYDTLTRSDSYRWVQQDRLGTKPAQQFIGPGPTTIQLPGVILPHFKGGLGQLDAMRAEADKGEELDLIDSLGKNWGKFCIKLIDETQSRLIASGQPRRIEFRVELISYGEDKKDGDV